ncbi:MAG: efflux RND transporter periplasmic adaptor subunit [Bacteroidales bacterium]|nr:efflux RND transporter periplasmic adaptor subunit [Bacteroidales bacterium]
MKKIISIIFISLFFACGQSNNPETIKKQIAEYKSQIADLENKIDELNTKLKNQGINSNTVKRIRVKTQQVLPVHFVHYVHSAASLEAVKSAFISPEISGQVKKIHVNEGDYVKKGQLLVSLNSDIIESNIKELETNLKLAKTLYEKQEELWKQQIGSEIQYLEAKNKKESLESKLNGLYIQLAKSKIKAPISGIVDLINVKEGELAMPGVQIIQMVNISTFYVNADVSEKFISVIKKGSPLKVSFPSFPGWKIDTKVYRIGNVINQSNRTFRVQAKIYNKNNMLKPNMLAKITFLDFEVDKALVVPSIIIKKDFKGSYLYIVAKNNNGYTAQKRYVKTSLSNDEGTMITEGISEGDKVIVKGYNLVKDGVDINIIND